ncbi:MAG: amidohydrolase family protein [Pseudomonadota bacterium]
MQKIIDCHLHAHWPSKYAYNAPTGSRIREDQLSLGAEGLDSALTYNGVHHALIIQPGAYGYDNSAMLAKIAASGKRYKGIANLPVETTAEEIRKLKTQGVMGVRLSQIHGNTGLFDVPGMDAFLKRCAEQDFFVEVFVPMAQWITLGPLLQKSGARVIIEHFGWPILEEGLPQTGLAEMQKFARDTKAVIKISAAFRVGISGPPYADLQPWAAMALDTFGPERCMWGSDWPFLNTDTGPRKKAVALPVAYRNELDAVRSWLADEKVSDQVLYKTPAALFGFED